MYQKRKELNQGENNTLDKQIFCRKQGCVYGYDLLSARLITLCV